jgi:CrcB protein
MSALVWLGVALVGGAGALLRYRLDALVQTRLASALPIGTLTVNLAGSFCLGLLAGLSLTGTALLLAGTAALGSFTTFATWMLETERLTEEGDLRLAGANVVLSFGAGVCAAAVGWLLGGVL